MRLLNMTREELIESITRTLHFASDKALLCIYRFVLHII